MRRGTEATRGEFTVHQLATPGRGRHARRAGPGAPPHLRPPRRVSSAQSARGLPGAHRGGGRGVGETCSSRRPSLRRRGAWARPRAGCAAIFKGRPARRANGRRACEDGAWRREAPDVAAAAPPPPRSPQRPRPRAAARSLVPARAPRSAVRRRRGGGGGGGADGEATARR